MTADYFEVFFWASKWWCSVDYNNGKNLSESIIMLDPGFLRLTSGFWTFSGGVEMEYSAKMCEKIKKQTTAREDRKPKRNRGQKTKKKQGN